MSSVILNSTTEESISIKINELFKEFSKKDISEAINKLKGEYNIK